MSKRGTLPISYPSAVQGKKLHKLLSEHAKNKTPSHTYGACVQMLKVADVSQKLIIHPLSLDPVQITQMAKYLETVYVSGWQSSSTASSTNEPGPDLAD